MEIQTINRSSYIVRIDKTELLARNLDIEELSAIDSKTLLDFVFDRSDSIRNDRIYLELITGHDELLLFICVKEESNAASYFFDNSEDLIAAAGECNMMFPSSLTYIDDEYVLTVYYDKDEEPPAVFEEFGYKHEYSPEYELFLKEHGKRLIKADAIRTLRKAFKLV